jgi:HAE1 family hydrophobic/amphiphilic exporter-1
MMTSLTTILGLIPMAMGVGEGSEAQIPLGRAVIGGLTSSTFINLFVVPCIYLLFHRKKKKAQEETSLAKSSTVTPESEPIMGK